LLVIFAAAFGVASYCLHQCPTRPLVSDGGGHPLRALRFVQQDALFRRTLICWMLKFAPPGRVADYMSVHTFLTGVRGVLAPVVAFYVVTVFPLAAVAALGSVLIIIGTLMLVPEIRESKRARKAPALVEEVSE
jgi:hypothetical protein